MSVAVVVVVLFGNAVLSHPYRNPSNPYTLPNSQPSLGSPQFLGAPNSAGSFPSRPPSAQGPTGWNHGAFSHRPSYHQPVKGSWRPPFGSPPTPASPTPSSTTDSASRIDFDAALLNPSGGQPTQNSVEPQCQDGGKMYGVGDKWTPEGGCGRRSCGQGGRTTFLGCPTVEAADNCTVTSPDPRQPWPSCCPTLVCQDDTPGF